MKANQTFHQQDMEMFAMVNEKTALRRQRREEMELACVTPVEDPLMIRRQNLSAAGGAALRVAWGLVILGGVARDLMNPLFGFCMATISFLCGWVHWRRNSYGNH